jgi:hypothetical protein
MRLAGHLVDSTGEAILVKLDDHGSQIGELEMMIAVPARDASTQERAGPPYLSSQRPTGKNVWRRLRADIAPDNHLT